MSIIRKTLAILKENYYFQYESQVHFESSRELFSIVKTTAINTLTLASFPCFFLPILGFLKSFSIIGFVRKNNQEVPVP